MNQHLGLQCDPIFQTLHFSVSLVAPTSCVLEGLLQLAVCVCILVCRCPIAYL